MKFAKAAITMALTIALTTAGTVATAAKISDTTPNGDPAAVSVTPQVESDPEPASAEENLVNEDQDRASLEVVVEDSLGDPGQENSAIAMMPEGIVESEVQEESLPMSRSVAEAASGGFGTELLSILNKARASEGLPPLKLTVAAQNYAQSFTQTWTDRHATCGTPSLAGCHMDALLGKESYKYRAAELKKQGWGNGGDLLARGYKDEAAVANAWLASEGHRKWIMDAHGSMNAIGVGQVRTSKTSGNVTTTSINWTLWIVGNPLTNPSPNLSEVGAPSTPAPSPSPAPPTQPSVAAAAVERLSGSCRYSTNLTLNQKQMSPGKPVFVATGSTFPDALSIGPAVAKENGSLFLAQQGHITAGALDLIAKNKPSAVYIVGGTGAISDSVASQVAVAAGKGASGYRRLAGTDRYSTSVKIFDTFFAGSSPSTVFVATGDNFPDALSAAAAGGAVNAPVLLVNGSGAASLNAAQAASLSKSKVKSVQIVGGSGVVNDALARNIRARGYAINRLYGSNRYNTNASVNKYVSTQVGSTVSDLWVATGSNFPDALSAAAPAGTSDARLVLSPGSCLPKANVSGILGGNLDNVHLVGGTGALNQSVAALKQC